MRQTKDVLTIVLTLKIPHSEFCFIDVCQAMFVTSLNIETLISSVVFANVWSLSQTGGRRDFSTGLKKQRKRLTLTVAKDSSELDGAVKVQFSRTERALFCDNNAESLEVWLQILKEKWSTQSLLYKILQVKFYQNCSKMFNHVAKTMQVKNFAYASSKAFQKHRQRATTSAY